jgi:hypothetical protein
MPLSLSNALFREVRPEFFRVLAGAKTGRLYVDALDALERAAAQRVQGIERDDALALVEEAVEAHADVPLDEADPTSAALSTREKARAVLDTLHRAGWLEDEERSDWQKLVYFHPSGQVLMQTLRRLAFPEGVVFSDKLVNVCTTLARGDATNDPLRLEPWQHVESSVAAFRTTRPIASLPRYLRSFSKSPPRASISGRTNRNSPHMAGRMRASDGWSLRTTCVLFAQ